MDIANVFLDNESIHGIEALFWSNKIKATINTICIKPRIDPMTVNLCST